MPIGHSNAIARGDEGRSCTFKLLGLYNLALTLLPPFNFNVFKKEVNTDELFVVLCTVPQDTSLQIIFVPERLRKRKCLHPHFMVRQIECKNTV